MKRLKRVMNTGPGILEAAELQRSEADEQQIADNRLKLELEEDALAVYSAVTGHDRPGGHE